MVAHVTETDDTLKQIEEVKTRVDNNRKKDVATYSTQASTKEEKTRKKNYLQCYLFRKKTGQISKNQPPLKKPPPTEIDTEKSSGSSQKKISPAAQKKAVEAVNEELVVPSKVSTRTKRCQTTPGDYAIKASLKRTGETSEEDNIFDSDLLSDTSLSVLSHSSDSSISNTEPEAITTRARHEISSVCIYQDAISLAEKLLPKIQIPKFYDTLIELSTIELERSIKYKQYL